MPTRTTPPLRLLRAQFAPSQPQVPLLSRARLIARLDGALQARLVVLVAPAGCGKSTLLGQWFQHLSDRRTRCGWLSILHEGGAADLILSICWSLQKAGVELDETGLLIDPIDEINPNERLAVLLSTIAQLDFLVVLIIDEVERLIDPDSIALLQLLIAACPPNLKVVIASRRPPEFSTSALRAQGLMFTIDAEELVFSMDEARDLLIESMDAENAELILHKTEGWPVAVALAKLWFQQDHRTAEALSNFGGMATDVSTYLAEQVIGALNPELRAFLLDVCLLDPISPRLADAVRSRSDSYGMISQLKQLKPMISVVDASTPVIRMHPLLADHLVRTLRLHGDEHYIQLHESAATAYFDAGRLLEGLRHALEVGNTVLACRLLVAQAPIRICAMHGSAEISACLRLLPEVERRRHPRLRLAELFLLIRRGEYALAMSEFDELSRDHSDTSVEYLLESFTIEALRGMRNPMLGEQILEELELAYKSSGTVDPWARFVIDALALVVNLRSGNLELARKKIYFQRAAYFGIAQSGSSLHALLHACHADLVEGSLTAAEAGVRKVLRNARSVVGPERSITILARALAVSVHYEMGSDHLNEGELSQILRDLERTDAWFDQYALAYRAAIEVAFQAEGLGPAASLISNGRIVAQRHGLGQDFEQLLTIFEADLLIRGGNPGAAELRLAGLGSQPTASRTIYGFDALMRVMSRIDLVRGNPFGALSLCVRWAEQATCQGRKLALCRAKLVEGLALHAVEKVDEGRAALHEAFMLAAPESAFAPFLEFREELTRIIADICPLNSADWDAVAEFVEMLTERLTRAAKLGRLVERLTQREMEIITRLELSNKRVALALGITEDAVKFHLKNVYRKLGVHSRADALRILKEAT